MIYPPFCAIIPNEFQGGKRLDYKKVFFKISSLTPRGIDFGAERERALLNELRSPDKKLKIVHIAGTNGKGSVAEYITQILIAAGKKTGTFTSPAVFDYLEQFKLDGKPVSEKLYAEAFGKVFKLIESSSGSIGGATRFEAETAGALNAFSIAGCEYAVIECGLGGKFDATNAIEKKEAAVITSIGLEHTAILGNTLEEICAQKAGIINNCPAVVSGLQPEEVKKYFENSGAKFPSTPYITGSDSFLYENKEFKLKMNGQVQPYNAAVAIEVARILKIDENAIYEGVKRAYIGGRTEILTAKSGRVYILDGAHNPAAVSALCDFLENAYGRADEVIYGSLSDKDIYKNLSFLKEVAAKINLVPCNSSRSADMEKLKEICENLHISAVQRKNTAEALKKSSGAVTVVCGSFTILREAKKWIEKRL